MYGKKKDHGDDLASSIHKLLRKNDLYSSAFGPSDDEDESTSSIIRSSSIVSFSSRTSYESNSEGYTVSSYYSEDHVENQVAVYRGRNTITDITKYSSRSSGGNISSRQGTSFSFTHTSTHFQHITKKAPIQGFANVFKGYSTQHQQNVIIKVHHHKRPKQHRVTFPVNNRLLIRDDDDDVEDAMMVEHPNEVIILGRLGAHPNIVEVLQCAVDETDDTGGDGDGDDDEHDLDTAHVQYTLVMPFLPDDEVKTMEDIRVIVRDVLEALLHCGELHVIHCDVKRANIRYNRAIKRAVLIDFDCAKYYADTRPIARFAGGIAVGTVGYQAPELFRSGHYDDAIDLWSLGVVLMEMICKKSFEGTPTPSVIEFMQKMTEPTNIYVDRDTFYANDLIRKMMTVDPSERISKRDALKHKFLCNTS